MVRPSTKGLYKGELCCRLLQTKLQVLNRKGPLLRNSHTGAAPLLHVCPSNREVSWTSQKSCMKSVEIRESLKRGADLGSVRICTASRCQRVGGVHMMHQVPSRIMHICTDERFQCQVILYTLGACELQGSSAEFSRQLHPASVLLPQEGKGA